MPKTPAPEAHAFFVDTRFQRMARRPGGVPRELEAAMRRQPRVAEQDVDFLPDQSLEHSERVLDLEQLVGAEAAQYAVHEHA